MWFLLTSEFMSRILSLLLVPFLLDIWDRCADPKCGYYRCHS